MYLKRESNIMMRYDQTVLEKLITNYQLARQNQQSSLASAAHTVSFYFFYQEEPIISQLTKLIKDSEHTIEAHLIINTFLNNIPSLPAPLFDDFFNQTLAVIHCDLPAKTQKMKDCLNESKIPKKMAQAIANLCTLPPDIFEKCLELIKDQHIDRRGPILAPGFDGAICYISTEIEKLNLDKGRSAAILNELLTSDILKLISGVEYCFNLARSLWTFYQAGITLATYPELRNLAKIFNADGIVTTCLALQERGLVSPEQPEYFNAIINCLPGINVQLLGSIFITLNTHQLLEKNFLRLRSCDSEQINALYKAISPSPYTRAGGIIRRTIFKDDKPRVTQDILDQYLPANKEESANETSPRAALSWLSINTASNNTYDTNNPHNGDTISTTTSSSPAV